MVRVLCKEVLMQVVHVVKTQSFLDAEKNQKYGGVAAALPWKRGSLFMEGLVRVNM